MSVTEMRPSDSHDADSALAAGPGRLVKARQGRRLTATQEKLLRYIAGETAVHGSVRCSKRDLAQLLGRNVKTIDRGITRLCREGALEVRMRHDERGAQIESEYRAVLGHAGGEGLLEALQRRVGCTYLSDLRDPANLPLVRHELRGVDADSFGLDEWNEAACYVTGDNVRFESGAEAREYLMGGNDGSP